MEKANVLHKLIKEQGYNLKTFSEKCNIPYTTVYGIIKNGVGKASVDNIFIICQNLGITLEELNIMIYGEIPKPEPRPIYEDAELLIARNGKKFSLEQKMKLIKLLSEIE